MSRSLIWQNFSSCPIFPLQCTAASVNFFSRPAWEILCKIFHWGRKVFADPAASELRFLAPLSSLRYIVAYGDISHVELFHREKECSRVRVRPCCLRPRSPANRRSGQIFSSRPMSPLRCIIASEIFSKSCDGNPMENFFIGEGKFLPTRRPAYFF